MAKRKAVAGSKSRKKKKADEEDEWFENITTQEDIDATVVNKMYHIHDECTKKRHNIPCKDNPNCFEMLGQSELVAKTKALPSTMGPNPNENIRKEGFPVGLKNLGATCYMNTLVQSLFMNTTFRQGIYNWNGTESEDKLLFQLKQLFAYLQYSASRYHDPVSFLQSTEMSSALQQDAQEFFKMIVTYIVEHANADIRKLVETQFMGKIAYNTECKKCCNKSVKESEFFELELNVKGSKTIEDSLKTYIKEEEMTGPNQYFCSNCNALQDGGRYISIRELPRVLSFQLLRFVYDMQTFTKKKVRDSISFPMTIDMRPFIEHKPPAPNINNNHNSSNNNSNNNHSNNNNNNNNNNHNNNDNNTTTNPIIISDTNDTTTTNTEAVTAQTTSNETNQNGSTPYPDSQAPSTPDTEPQGRVTRSHTKQQNPPPAPPTSSSSSASSTSDTEEFIYELTSVMMHRGLTAYGGHYVVHVKDERTGKWWQINDEDVKPIEEAKVGVIDDSLYDSSAANTSSETAPTPIDVDAITAESSSTPPSPSKKKAKPKAKGAKAKGKGKGKGKAKDDKEQDGDDSGEGEKTKDSQDKGRISSTMAYMVTYARRGRPTVSPAPSPAISEAISKEMDTLRATAQEYDRLLEQETGRLTARKVEFEQILPELKPKEGEPYNWISTEWLSSWIKCSPDLSQIDNTRLMCAHDRVDPTKISEMKRISKLVWDSLNKDQYLGGPELTQDRYCVDCIFGICKDEKENTTSNKEKKSLLQELATTDEREGFWISKDWFKEYSKNSPEDLSDDMTSELLCPHGNLTASTKSCKLLTKKVWEQLRASYPNGPTFPSDVQPCQECVQQDNETRELDDRRKKEKQTELKSLREFHTKVKTRSSEPLCADTQYIISYDWCLKWKEWLDSPEGEDPPPINNSDLLCCHDKLVYDPVAPEEDLLPSDTAKMSLKPETNGTNGTTPHANGEKEILDLTSDAVPSSNSPADSAINRAPPKFLLIKAKFWEQLHDKHGGGPIIACSSKSCSYEVCVDCLKSRKQQEEDEAINYTAGSLFVQRAPNGDGKEAPFLPKRSSSRYRLREKNPKRQVSPINSLTDTVQSLKLRIYQLLEVPPFQQALWFNDVLLENEASPLCSYRVPNGSDITLVIVEGNDEVLEAENASKGQCEQGFKGSIFYSKSAKETTEPPQDTTENTPNTDSTKEDVKEDTTIKEDSTADKETPTNTTTTATTTTNTTTTATTTNTTNTTTDNNNQELPSNSPPSPSTYLYDEDVPMEDCYVSVPKL